MVSVYGGMGGGGGISEDSIIFKSTHKSRTKTTSLIFIAITLTVL